MAQRRLKTEEPLLAWATATRTPQIVEASGHPGAPTAAHLFAGGLRKQQMRDCKGIKILSAICPSSCRNEDFLPQPELWNRRLSRVSFLLTLFLLSWFPVRWSSCHFHCAGFFSRSASFPRAFSELSFCCAWPPPHRGRAEVV